MIKAHQAEAKQFALSTMCRVLGVSTSGYYDWCGRGESPRAIENAALAERIAAIHEASRCTYGMLRIQAELRDREDGHYDRRWASVGRNRIARLMRAAGLRGVSRRRGYTVTTKRDGQGRGAPDLLGRDFRASGPNVLWVSDITYVPTWAGFVYLAIVLDAWSRKVVGWSIGQDLKTELVLDALNMALTQRKAFAVIHHSDHGCQYTSFAFGKRCEEMGVWPSMGSVGDAYDNAMAESFFATLEAELLARRTFPNKADAKSALFSYIEGWYNPSRRHSSIGYLAPNVFEQRHAKARSDGLLAGASAAQTDPAGA
jgi:putative transposase